MIWKLQGMNGHTRTWEFATALQPFEIKFNTVSLSLRVRGNTRRLFFIEQTKLRPNRVAFNSEYGHRVGICEHLPGQQQGRLLLHQHRFYYQQKADVVQLLDNGLFPLTSCTIHEALNIKPVELAALLFTHLWLYDSMVEL
jgi:hypothetical protein